MIFYKLKTYLQMWVNLKYCLSSSHICYQPGASSSTKKERQWTKQGLEVALPRVLRVDLCRKEAQGQVQNKPKSPSVLYTHPRACTCPLRFPCTQWKPSMASLSPAWCLAPPSQDWHRLPLCGPTYSPKTEQGFHLAGTWTGTEKPSVA